MAPKPEPAGLASASVFGIVIAVAAILAGMTWAIAAPESSIYPIYQPQLPLLY